MIEKVELLPYHSYGSFKYKELKMEYPLEGIEDLNADILQKAKDIFKNHGL